MRMPLLALVLAALIVPGSAGAADRDDGIPTPLRALLDRAVARDGPLPTGPSLGILTLLKRAGLLNAPPGETEAYLTCPAAPEIRALTWPDLPADDDCDLTTPAVRDYVGQLLENAATCSEHAVAAHGAVIAAKADLDAQVDLLPTGGTEAFLFHTDAYVAPDPYGQIQGHALFTEWLSMLTANAQGLCAHSEMIFERIEVACDELNELLTAQGGALSDEQQRASFHARLAEALAEASGLLGIVTQNHALLVADAQAFLESFSEEAACPERSGIAGLLARARALAAFRESLRASRAFELALRLREVHVYLWYEGRLVVLTAPAFVVARLTAEEEEPDR